MIDINAKTHMFIQLEDHRNTIKTAVNNIRDNSSPEECEKIKACTTNTKNINVKLDDFREAQAHSISEFTKGIFNIIGGVFALFVLAVVQAICLPTVFVPIGCKMTTGSFFLPGFSDMSNVVARGASRVNNAFTSFEQLQNKVEKTVEELRAELKDTLPNSIISMASTRASLEFAQKGIDSITQLEIENQFIVYENTNGIFVSIRAIDADNIPLVKLVNDLMDEALSHREDLGAEIQASLDEFVNDLEFSDSNEANNIEEEKSEIFSEDDNTLEDQKVDQEAVIHSESSED
ncbi:MAG: hypothetical protein H0T62_10480 [Parachlamydiaceae bacterium]|nr:hypothetical protein [Parachlamydiaceae bacterium]